MKKVLFLVLSASTEHITANEIAIRNTWGAEVSKYENAQILYVKCAPPEALNDTIQGDTIFIAAPDGLTRTYSKMYRALVQVMIQFPDFDYLVRVNTSTWCNVDGTMAFLGDLSRYGLDYVRAFPGQLISHADKPEWSSASCVPYWLGNAFILRKDVVKDIVLQGFVDSSDFKGVDDILMSYVESRHLMNLYGNFIQFYKSIGVFYARAEDDPECSTVTGDVLDKYLFVQVKNFLHTEGEPAETPPSRANEPSKIRSIHARWYEHITPQTLNNLVANLVSNLNKCCSVKDYGKLEELLGPVDIDSIPKSGFNKYIGWHTWPKMQMNLEEMIRDYGEKMQFRYMSLLSTFVPPKLPDPKVEETPEQ